MNPERFKSDKVIVSDTDGNEVDLPLVFHRNLSAAHRLSHAFERKYLSKLKTDKEKIDFMIKRSKTSTEELKKKEFIDNSMSSFDCHIFFLRALGFKIKLDHIFKNIVSYSFNIFRDSDYADFKSPDELKSHISKLFNSLGTNLLASQITDNEGKLSHSLFFMKFKDEILCYQKLGWNGLFHANNIDYFFDYKYFNDVDNYGTRFAFADWYEVATNPDLHKRFEEKYGG